MKLNISPDVEDCDENIEMEYPHDEATETYASITKRLTSCDDVTKNPASNGLDQSNMTVLQRAQQSSEEVATYEEKERSESHENDQTRLNCSPNFEECDENLELDQATDSYVSNINQLTPCDDVMRHPASYGRVQQGSENILEDEEIEKSECKEKDQKMRGERVEYSAILKKNKDLENVKSCNILADSEKQKFLLIHDEPGCMGFFSPENVDFVSFISPAVPTTQKHKEMFIFVHQTSLRPSTDFCRYKYEYLLAMCKFWRKTCPQAEIHLFGWKLKKEPQYEETDELRTLLDTCVRVSFPDYKGGMMSPKAFSRAISSHWSRFVPQLIPEKIRKLRYFF